MVLLYGLVCVSRLCGLSCCENETTLGAHSGYWVCSPGRTNSAEYASVSHGLPVIYRLSGLGVIKFQGRNSGGSHPEREESAASRWRKATVPAGGWGALQTRDGKGCGPGRTLPCRASAAAPPPQQHRSSSIPEQLKTGSAWFFLPRSMRSSAIDSSVKAFFGGRPWWGSPEMPPRFRLPDPTGRHPMSGCPPGRSRTIPVNIPEPGHV